MGRPPKLSLAGILDAAASILDAEGPEGLSLRGLARALVVTAPSVMAHVGDLSQLQERLRAEAQQALADAVRAAGDGAEAVLNGWRGFATEHPGRYALLAETPRALAEGPVLRAAMQALGHEDRTRTLALIAALHGFVTLEGAGGLGVPRAADGVAIALLPLRQADAVATLSAASPAPGRPPTDAFRTPRLRLGGRGGR